MIFHALIPVKSLENAKSRLANNLSLEERKKLVLQMLDHVLSVLHTCEEIQQISVVSSDSDVKKHLRKSDVIVLPEEKQGHNPALTTAAKHETRDNDHALLTISADLPLLTKNDIQQMLMLTPNHHIVIAPAKDNGTNILITHPPLVLPYLFGKDSFEKYRKEAEKRKLSVAIYKSKTAELDIDTPEDLYFIKQKS